MSGAGLSTRRRLLVSVAGIVVGLVVVALVVVGSGRTPRPAVVRTAPGRSTGAATTTTLARAVATATASVEPAAAAPPLIATNHRSVTPSRTAALAYNGL